MENGRTTLNEVNNIDNNMSVTGYVVTVERVTDGHERFVYFILPRDFIDLFDGFAEELPSIMWEAATPAWGYEFYETNKIHKKVIEMLPPSAPSPVLLKYRACGARTAYEEEKLIRKFKDELQEAVNFLAEKLIRKPYCREVTVSSKDNMGVGYVHNNSQ